MGRVKEAAQAWDAVLKKDPANPLAQIYRRLCDNGRIKTSSQAAKK
jgi:hypothetical protein